MRRIALAFVLCLSGCGARESVAAHPALWRVGDGDTTIWLLGSIHALPPGVRWETPAVAHAITTADTLILEVPPGEADTTRALFLTMGQRAGLPPIRARVAARERDALARGMAAAGQSPATLDGLKTWAAALTIATGAARAEDASAADGVEAVLAQRFAGRKIGALESHAGQFAAFDRLPEASQRFLLTRAADDAVRAGAGYATLLSGWAAGDERALAEDVAPLLTDPAIGAALVRNRNARWASAIVRRLARPGRVLVAVGAGHLVGAGSVVAMLRARGLRVERVE